MKHLEINLYTSDVMLSASDLLWYEVLLAKTAYTIFFAEKTAYIMGQRE
jgi:hypothetical protein